MGPPLAGVGRALARGTCVGRAHAQVRGFVTRGVWGPVPLRVRRLVLACLAAVSDETRQPG